MSFSLANLQPDGEPFDLGDRVIYFRNKQDFDLQELAAWQRLQKTVQNVVKMREKAQSEQQHVSASAKSYEAAKEIINLVLPDLPGKTFESLARAADRAWLRCLWRSMTIRKAPGMNSVG